MVHLAASLRGEPNPIHRRPMKYLIGNVIAVAAAAFGCAAFARGNEPPSGPSSSSSSGTPPAAAPAAQEGGPPQPFEQLVTRSKAEKPEFAKGHQALLESRYDLADKAAPGTKMSRGKPVQAGVRVKLPAGETWDSLAAKTPEEIKSRDVFPAGFLPVPHPNHAIGGMVFPKPTI